MTTQRGRFVRDSLLFALSYGVIVAAVLFG